MARSEAANVLVVEDEPKIAELLADYLRNAGYGVECVGDGERALELIRDRTPALIVLDLMLPGLDGMEVCKQVRRFSDVPIIMVTAKVEEVDRLIGLELGADDYICKPFSPREVVARVKAVLRRTCRAMQGPKLEIDRQHFTAMLDGRPLDLTRVEFRLLAHLADEPGRVFGRDALLDVMYNDYREVADRTVDSHVKNLRRKLEAVLPGNQLIQSIYGVGYRIDPGA